MKRQKQQLHVVMDESDAPYKDGERVRTTADDLDLIRFAKENGLQFEPGSYLDTLSRTMSADTVKEPTHDHV